MRRGWGGCGDRGPDGAPGRRQACSPLRVSVRVSLSPLLRSPFSVSSRGLNGWILLHLYPGQRLLLGRNKSWGFLSSQLSGEAPGGRAGRIRRGFGSALGSRAAPACWPQTPCRSLDLQGLLSCRQLAGVRRGCRELGATQS